LAGEIKDTSHDKRAVVAVAVKRFAFLRVDEDVVAVDLYLPGKARIATPDFAALEELGIEDDLAGLRRRLLDLFERIAGAEAKVPLLR